MAEDRNHGFAEAVSEKAGNVLRELEIDRGELSRAKLPDAVGEEGRAALEKLIEAMRKVKDMAGEK